MKKAKILIVEDEAIIAMEIENQLQSLGYEVISVVDTGEKAIKKAKEDKPDLILMDIRIKGEMDGIEAAEEIRNKFGVPVIFSTAYLDQERIERAKITMPFGYVLKPIQERDLKVTIEMALYVSKVDADRRKIEEKLRMSEEKYKITFETNPDSVTITSLDGLYIDVNGGFSELTGYSYEEVIGKLSSEINIWVKSEDRLKFISELKRIGFVENMETEFKRKDGSFVSTLMSASIIELNKEQHILLITKDITDRIQSEEALQKSEEKYRNVVDNVNEAIFVAQDKKLKYFNPKTAELLESSENELSTKPFIRHLSSLKLCLATVIEA